MFLPCELIKNWEKFQALIYLVFFFFENKRKKEEEKNKNWEVA